MEFTPRTIKITSSSKHWGGVAAGGRSDGTELAVEFDISGYDTFDETLTRAILQTQRKLDALALLTEYCKGAIDAARYKVELSVIKERYGKLLKDQGDIDSEEA